MGILDFFSREAGQQRRAALDDFGRDLGYYVPPELRSRLGLLASMNPVEGVSRSMQASERMTAPGRTPMQRVGDAGEMLSEVAGVVAPVAVAGRAGMPAAQAVQEAFMGFGAPLRQSADIAFSNQADAFRAANRPVVPAPDVPQGAMPFVPTAAEIPRLPVDVSEFTYPVASVTGAPLGSRFAVNLTPEQIVQVRPGAFDDINYATGTGTNFGSIDYNNRTISLHPDLSPNFRENVRRHELTHLGLSDSGLNAAERGSNISRMRDYKNETVGELRRLLRSPDTSAADRAAYTRLLQELSGLTPREMYELNPGESLARLAGEAPTTARRLTPSQVLNPELNPGVGPTKRAAQALGTAVASSVGPVGRALSRVDPYINHGVAGYDVFTKVPMDMSRLRAFGPYNPLDEPNFVRGRTNFGPGLLSQVDR